MSILKEPRNEKGLSRIVDIIMTIIVIVTIWAASLNYGSYFYLRGFDAEDWVKYHAPTKDFPYRCQMGADAKRKFAKVGTQDISVVASLGTPDRRPDDGSRTLRYDLGKCFRDRGELVIKLDDNNKVISAELF